LARPLQSLEVMNANAATLHTARSNARIAYEAYSRAMNTYLATETDHIETPASMHNAPMADFVAFHPAFGLLEMRRQRMETLYAAWQAAERAAREQLVFPFVEGRPLPERPIFAVVA